MDHPNQVDTLHCLGHLADEALLQTNHFPEAFGIH